MSSLFEALQDVDDLQKEAHKKYEAEVDEWWSALPTEDKERAFYSVVKRIYENELVQQGSYRYILYDVFGFGPHMYIAGMDCGFMSLHNAIKTEAEQQIIDEFYAKKGAL